MPFLLVFLFWTIACISWLIAMLPSPFSFSFNIAGVCFAALGYWSLHIAGVPLFEEPP